MKVGGAMVCLGSLSECNDGVVDGFVGTARGALVRRLARRSSLVELGQPICQLLSTGEGGTSTLRSLLASFAGHGASVPPNAIGAHGPAVHGVRGRVS